MRPTVLGVIGVAGFCAALVAAQELPEGTGKDVTARLCSVECHGLEKVVAERHSKSQWMDSLNNMRDQGAKGTDDEFKAIAAYLTMHFGVPVRINKVTAKQLDEVMILEPGQADAIIKYRDENGPFADLAALLKVPGLNVKLIEEQKTNLVFAVTSGF
jgi:competence ComEA-like helix-hairpin-helix protein